MLLSLLLCVPLKWLSPTSGNGAEAVLDGNPATKWTPPGNPLNEGVMFVFEEPQDIERVSAGDGVTIYCGGAEQGTRRCGKTDKVFVKLTGASSLSEVSFSGLKVTPPRTVAGEVTASATLAPIDAFHPSFAFDGRLDFGWAVTNGEGQSLTFSFSAPQTITAIELYNGYQRSDDHFKKNARVKTLLVNDTKVDVKDASGPQRLAVSASGKTITLKIGGVYPGSKYKDLVISELRFFDKDGAFVPVASQRELPAAHRSGVFGPIIDQPLNGCGESFGTLKLRSNESFVAYVNTQDGPDDTVSKVIEGAWIPSAAGVFDIYARQYVVRSMDRPYGPAKVTKHTGVLGGKHTVKNATPEDVERFGCKGDVVITGPVFNGIYAR